MGLDPWTLGSSPEPKAEAQSLSHPGIPYTNSFHWSRCKSYVDFILLSSHVNSGLISIHPSLQLGRQLKINPSRRTSHQRMQPSCEQGHRQAGRHLGTWASVQGCCENIRVFVKALIEASPLFTPCSQQCSLQHACLSQPVQCLCSTHEASFVPPSLSRPHSTLPQGGSSTLSQ